MESIEIKRGVVRYNNILLKKFKDVENGTSDTSMMMNNNDRLMEFHSATGNK